MSKLITWQEALHAIADGEEVQVRFKDTSWKDLTINSKFDLSNFSNSYSYQFRLKPRTIMIGDVEVPAPFDPKEGDTCWFISGVQQFGYNLCIHSYGCSYEFGVWRIEEEIKQVVAALKKLFKGD